jgi:hypothetical protein
MKRRIGEANGICLSLETNRVGVNVIFVDLGGSSYDVVASTPAEATALVRKLRKLADTIEARALEVGVVNGCAPIGTTEPWYK